MSQSTEHMSSPLEIWVSIAREKYPTLTENDLRALSMTAAASWYAGGDTELAMLFDQYVMMKNLKGL